MQTSFSFGNNQITLTLQTDNFGSETSWEIVNATNSNIIHSGNGFASLSTYIENICIPNGCYQLIVRDSYGDGLQAPTNGNYQLTDAAGTLLASLQQPNFGMQEVTNFCIESELPFPVSIQEPSIQLIIIRLSPNPMQESSTQLLITLPQVQTSSLRIYHVSGKEVLNSLLPASKTHQLTINLSDYPSGVYLVQVKGEAGVVATSRLVKW